MKVPLIGINDSGGARIQEGVNSLAGTVKYFSGIRWLQVLFRRSRDPCPCAGGAVYSPALTDFLFCVESISKMFITGPKLSRPSLAKRVSMDGLVEPEYTAKLPGNAHFYAENEPECLSRSRSFCPLYRPAMTGNGKVCQNHLMQRIK